LFNFKKFEQLDLLKVDTAKAVFLLSTLKVFLLFLTKDVEFEKRDSFILLIATTLKNYRQDIVIYAQCVSLKYKDYLYQIGIDVRTNQC
jgi:hypothetical protein